MNIQPKPITLLQVDYFKRLLLDGLMIQPSTFCALNNWLIFRGHILNPAVISQLLDSLVEFKLVIKAIPEVKVSCTKQETFTITTKGEDYARTTRP